MHPPPPSSLPPPSHCTSPPFHFLSPPLLFSSFVLSRAHMHFLSLRLCTITAVPTASHVRRRGSPPMLRRETNMCDKYMKLNRYARKGSGSTERYSESGWYLKVPCYGEFTSLQCFMTISGASSLPVNSPEMKKTKVHPLHRLLIPPFRRCVLKHAVLEMSPL